MTFFGYTRTDSEEGAEAVKTAMRVHCATGEGSVLAGFSWDAMSGQRGLMQALRWADTADLVSKAIMVDSLSDLARDVPGLVKQIETLLRKEISIYSLATGLLFDAESEDPETKVIKALAQAHVRYTSENRRQGQQSARAGGAIIGRPVAFTLDGARKTIESLSDSNAGELPSVRKLAKELGCGHTKAGELLAEYRAEKNEASKQKESENEHEAGTSEV